MSFGGDNNYDQGAYDYLSGGPSVGIPFQEQPYDLPLDMQDELTNLQTPGMQLNIGMPGQTSIGSVDDPFLNDFSSQNPPSVDFPATDWWEDEGENIFDQSQQQQPGGQFVTPPEGFPSPSLPPMTGPGMGAGEDGLPGSLYPIPQAPSMQGVLTGISPYAVSPAPVPMGDWYNNLDPNVRAGVERPYTRMFEQLGETLGAQGQLGSARGGLSGAGANVLGQMAQDAAPHMAQQAWNMVSPGAFATWGAGLDRSKMGHQLALQEQMGDYQQELGRRGEFMQQMQMPYQMAPGMMGGTYSTPVHQPSSGSLGGGLTGALLGGIGTMGMGGPWGALGPLLGGLGGLFGG